MALSSESLALLFKINADTGNAESAVKAFSNSVLKDVDKLSDEGTSKLGHFGTALSALSGPAGISALAVTALGAAVVATGVALFEFTKQAAEYGSAIFDAKIRTGLTAEAITALKFAADISGSSLETVSGAVSKFNVLVGEGAQHTKHAEELLKKYGITSRDTTEAFNQAIAAIGKMTSADEKAVAARELFKDKTGQMLPIVDQLNGKFNEYIETAKKLGVTLTEEDLAAADKFGDTLDLLGTQAKIAGEKFATALMPMITSAMEEISRYLAENQDVVREWGRSLSDTLRGVKVAFVDVADALPYLSGAIGAYLASTSSETASWADKMIESLSHVGTYFGAVGVYIESLGAANRPPEQMGPYPWEMTPTRPKFAMPKTGGGKGGAGKKDDSANKDLKAQIEDLKLYLKDYEKEYKDTLERLRKEFEKNPDHNAFAEAADAAKKKFQDLTNAANASIDTLELKAAGRRTPHEQSLEVHKQLDRQKEQNTLVRDEDDKNLKTVEDHNKKAAENLRKIWADLAKDRSADLKAINDLVVAGAEKDYQAVVDANQGILDNDNATTAARQEAYDAIIKATGDRDRILRYEAEVMHEATLEDIRQEYEAKKDEIEKEILDEDDKTTAILALIDELKRKRQAAADEYKQQQDELDSKATVRVKPAGTPSSAQQQLADYAGGIRKGTAINTAAIAGVNALTTAFDGLGQALGNVINAWVLYGTVGQSARQITAQILASIAQQAAVKAIFEVAEGFAMLALAFFGHPGAGPSATQHFIAAGVYASIAGIAAITGRAVAGSSFSQQATSSPSTSAASGGSRNGGTQYSDKSDITKTGSRNAPAGFPPIRVEIGLDKNGVLKLLSSNKRNNGPFRTMLRDG